MSPYFLLKWIWIAFGCFWLLAAFAQKRNLRRQSAGSRMLQLAIIVLAIAPFYSDRARLGVLGDSFVRATLPIQNFGLLLLLIGVGFAVWARFVLGTNWSGIVTVKENHVLIMRGPYALVRHPIYTGILLGLLGTAFVGGTYANLFAAAMATLALWLKLRLEEKFMRETFGDQYMDYSSKVKALVPYVI